jgi:hypothetical protein
MLAVFEAYGALHLGEDFLCLAHKTNVIVTGRLELLRDEEVGAIDLDYRRIPVVKGFEKVIQVELMTAQAEPSNHETRVLRGCFVQQSVQAPTAAESRVRERRGAAIFLTL